MLLTTSIARGPTRVDTEPATMADLRPGKPVLDGVRPRGESALVYVFTILPTLALAVAVTMAWGWGLS